MAGIGLALKGLGLLGKKKKGNLLMKNFKKRLKKPPNKLFREDKSYTLMKGSPHAKTYQHITSGKKQKKKILAEQHASKRSFEATGDEWGPHKGAWKAKGGRIGFKRAGPVTKADLAKRDLWTKRELKRRSQIGQRKSKWDIKGGISGHPLNPLRIHAAGKATDWTSKRKDVYGRTRDDLKKSRDPAVKKVAEGFQKMDWKDESKGTQFEKDYEPKLKQRIHVRRQGKFAGALVRGAKNIVKHTPWRKELAGLKKTHRAKQKILKGKAARKEAASKAALAPNYGPYGKQLASQAQHPKSWRRAGKI